jgi:N-terminal domain of galactosyltransferase
MSGYSNSAMPPSLSLVSYVRDRTSFLAGSLPHWRAAPEVSEIVVVDYGSAEPVDPALFEGDPRCRLIRVENAPYWKQSKAENLAIAEATGPLILKLDVDTYLLPEVIPALLTLAPCQFITGSPVWTQSGQALFWKADWAAIGGYHEFLSGWGHDDHDFYRRLLARGLERFEFPAEMLRNVEHEDHLRTAGGVAVPRRLRIPESVLRNKEFSNARNKILAYLVPWDETLREIPARRELDPTGLILTLGLPSAREEGAVEVASFFAACLFEPNQSKALVDSLAPYFGVAQEEDAAKPVTSASAIVS